VGTSNEVKMKLMKLYQTSPLELKLTQNLGKYYMTRQKRRSLPSPQQYNVNFGTEGAALQRFPRYKKYFGGALTK
jgi:hypothetical protein